MKAEILQALLEDRRSKRPVALLTHIASGEQSLVYENDSLGDIADNQLIELARGALSQDRSGMHESAAGQVFIQVFNPPLRLLIVGAVHIAQFLAPMAQLSGYEVVIVDPRSAWSTGRRFADVKIIDQWPDEAMAALAPDRRTAVVTLTHDPKLDDPALQVSLTSAAFYIGSLGSRRTHAARLERLHSAGLGDQQTARIHAPIGLPINAKSPAEIAIAILAEITQTLRKSSP